MSLHRTLLLSLVLPGLSACSGCGGTSKPAKPAAAPARKMAEALPADAAEARRVLLERVRAAKSPVVVVALDGETLFTSAARSQRIFFEVLAEMGHIELMRTMMQRVKAGEQLRHQAALVRAAGITSEKELDLIKRRFNERLHSDAYIPDDRPRSGAAAFFAALHQAGAHLVYISSDDLMRSGPGWVQLLRNHRFPVLSPGASLILPPRPDGLDEAFLTRRRAAVEGLGEVVATFAVLKADAESLAAVFPSAAPVLVQPVGKPDRPGWADFGSPADWAPKTADARTP